MLIKRCSNMYFCSKINIWNVKYAQARAFIFDSRTDVLVNILYLVQNWISSKHRNQEPLKRKCHHFDVIIVTRRKWQMSKCQLSCSQLWKFRQNDISVSVSRDELILMPTFRIDVDQALGFPLLQHDAQNDEWYESQDEDAHSQAHDQPHVRTRAGT